jgi:chorismate mutase/prephenate dehydratase
MTLDELRDGIDRLDDQILDLLNERMEFVQQVGELKHTTGGAIYRPEREKAIIDRLEQQSNGILNRGAIEALFLEIFAISRNIERPENIAYLGPVGTFTHQAAESRFGAMSHYIPLHSISAVFRAVNAKQAKYGVIPIENSSNGIVSDSINNLVKYDLKIVAEIVMQIHHSFATLAEDITKIKRIYSKDIVFDQCHNFIEDYNLLDNIELIPVESTAKAAMMAKKDKESAAICAVIAAKLYNLPILHENIEDKENNQTRFLIISDFENAQSGGDKTSIFATMPNRAGALVEFLTDFQQQGINLTKIKSHIIEGISHFFIDFDGHFNDSNVDEVLKKHRDNVKVLGSYVKEADDI